jgi:hypothetical protein
MFVPPSSADNQLVDEMEDADPGSATPAGNEDDLEAQLKSELEGLTGAAKVKSTRFRLCQHDTPCGESEVL